MNTERLKKILTRLQERGLSQMIICDPLAINYLTGRMVDPGERLYALYITSSGNHRIFINNLFTVPEDLGVEKVRFSDTDDYLALLADCLTPGEAVGVDKNFPARFLLPVMERSAAGPFVLSSVCVDEVRACKDEEEKEIMRISSQINDRAMARFRELIRPGVTELEMANQMMDIYRELGAEAYSFSPIVAFGPNAAKGHHEPDDTVLKDGDCVLIDVGCKYKGYCSDMTRTFFYKQEPSEKHRRIYELVKQAVDAAEALCKPGVPLCDIDAAARDIIEKAGYGPNFTHRLGHFIGQEDHEYGDVSSSNQNLTQAGNVFSIEPGIYIDDDMGVRIEDLVIITEDGCEILNSYSKELSVVE